MEYFTYVLYSKTIDRFYIGHTGDTLKERLRKHLSDHKGFTAKAKDWQYFHVEPFDNRTEAYRRELDIKRKKSRKYIERLKDSSAG